MSNRNKSNFKLMLKKSTSIPTHLGASYIVYANQLNAPHSYTFEKKVKSDASYMQKSTHQFGWCCRYSC